jgi:hypothetical protein
MHWTVSEISRGQEKNCSYLRQQKKLLRSGEMANIFMNAGQVWVPGQKNILPFCKKWWLEQAEQWNVLS